LLVTAPLPSPRYGRLGRWAAAAASAAAAEHWDLRPAPRGARPRAASPGPAKASAKHFCQGTSIYTMNVMKNRTRHIYIYIQI